MGSTRILRVAFAFASSLLVMGACGEPDQEETPETSTIVANLSAETRQARLESMRDIAAEMGLYNGALLGGIAISETGLAHCWSEATWACQGPASASCDGGPVIAGSADGPCGDEQGGLGMFQFDAGTYAQTRSAYGDDVLTVEGNTALAVNFLVTRSIESITEANDWRSSMAWMNSVNLSPGDPVADQWGRFLACRYNGCCSTSSLCLSRANGYRDNAIEVYAEMGEDFWRTADRCTQLPEDGVIDQRSTCYLAAGNPKFWHREASGHADNSEWTMTEPGAAPANYAQWQVRTNRAATYHVDVNLDGGVHGKTAQATYVIVHAGQTDTVVIDQTAATGFVTLGDFAFSGEGDEYVLLGDNVDGPATQLLFDAIRVTPVDGMTGSDTPGGDDVPAVDPTIAGGCAVGGGADGVLVIVAVGLLGLRRRRRLVGVALAALAACSSPTNGLDGLDAGAVDGEVIADAEVVADGAAIPTSKVLTVDYQVQETGYWCGPAATRIALSARMANPPSQQSLADQLGTTVNGTDYIGQITTVLNANLDTGWYVTKEMPNDPPTQSERDLLWSDIVANINNDYAIVANIVAPPGNQPPGYPSDQTIYHYFAIIGYNAETMEVYIADSANFGSNTLYWLSFDQVATLIPPKGYST